MVKRKVWNDGLTKETDRRLNYYRPTCFKKGLIPHNKGIKNGLYIICKTCNKNFYIIASNKSRKYCSVECVNRHTKRTNESKLRYSLSKMGDKNPAKKPEVREKQRLIKQKKILELGGPRLGNDEKQILDELELFLNTKIIRQFPIKGYWVDGYIKKYNIVIEVDEKPKIKPKDLERENIIKQELNCSFVRIPLW